MTPGPANESSPAPGLPAEPLQPGHYWKTPFYWEPGCPPPPEAGAVAFSSITDEALRPLIGGLMASGTDASDRFNVPRIGIDAAVEEVFDYLPRYFERDAGWWRVAIDAAGAPLGFVLPVTFQDERCWKGGRPQGTILYMGVLPDCRGRGVGLQLVHEATRVLLGAKCWRVFCDTGTENASMVKAFRDAGYREAAPWQRPLA